MDSRAAVVSRDAAGTEKGWTPRDLAFLGVYASLLALVNQTFGQVLMRVPLVGGFLLAGITSGLLTIALYKVNRFGTLTLMSLIKGVFMSLGMGGHILVLPFAVIAGLLGDIAAKILGGYRRAPGLITGTIMHEAALSAFGYVVMCIFGFIAVPMFLEMFAIGVFGRMLGCVLGVVLGLRYVKELQRAGVIHCAEAVR